MSIPSGGSGPPNDTSDVAPGDKAGILARAIAAINGVKSREVVYDVVV